MREKRVIISSILAIGLFYGMAAAECRKSEPAKTCNSDNTNTCSPKSGSCSSNKQTVRVIIMPRIIWPSSRHHKSNPYRFVPTDSPAEQNKKIDYIPAAVHIANLEGIFDYAEKTTADCNVKTILKGCLEANKAKYIYETCWAKEFQQTIEDANFADGIEKRDVSEAAKIIAGKRYLDSFTEFQNAKTENFEAAVKGRDALKSGIVQKTKEDKKRGYINPNLSGNYLPKFWACVAINPRNGCRLLPNTGEPNQQQDAITIEAFRVLNEIGGVAEKTDANEVTEPNNLMI